MLLNVTSRYSPDPSLWDMVGVAGVLAFLVLLLVGKRLFRKPPGKTPEHAVLVTIPLSDGGFGSPEEREQIHGVTNELDRVIKSRQAGEFDGDEFGAGKCTLYMYGPDADALFDAVAPILRANLPPGSLAVKRYGKAGDPNVRKETLPL